MAQGLCLGLELACSESILLVGHVRSNRDIRYRHRGNCDRIVCRSCVYGEESQAEHKEADPREEGSFVAVHGTSAQGRRILQRDSRHTWNTKKLGFVTQPLLVPIRLHAFATLMFGDFGFAAFFD